MAHIVCFCQIRVDHSVDPFCESKTHYEQKDRG